MTIAYLPPLLALGAAFLFALSDHLVNKGLDGADARSGAVVAIATSAVVFIVLAPFTISTAYWLTAATALFALVGVFRPALSITLALMGISHMGPTLASALAATSPIFGAALAIALLGESLTLPVAVGTLAVVAGVAVSAWKPGKVARSWPVWAVAFPLGAAFIRAAGHVINKVGMEEVPSAMHASLVGNIVSAVVAYGVFRMEGRRFSGAPASYRWFVAAGLVNGLSIYILNEAILHGSIVTVLPIAASMPIFTMALGLLVFRREIITWRTLVTVGLIVPGVILVVVKPGL